MDNVNWDLLKVARLCLDPELAIGRKTSCAVAAISFNREELIAMPIIIISAHCVSYIARILQVVTRNKPDLRSSALNGKI